MFKSKVIYLITYAIESALSFMLCYQVWTHVLLYSLFFTLDQLSSLPAADREGCQDFPSLSMSIIEAQLKQVTWNEELCLKNPRATNLVAVDYMI